MSCRKNSGGIEGFSVSHLENKVSKYGVFSGPYFSPFGLITEFTSEISLFSPNTGKYQPEKTPYFDAFHTVCNISHSTKDLLN